MPLQSLVLMNDPVFGEAARAFAQRILQQGSTDDSARLDDTQLAAWTAVANVLLNLNETISN